MSGAVRTTLAVGLGSAAGAVCRALISLVFIGSLGTELPWATLITNGLGSLLIGFVAALGAPTGRWPISDPVRHLLMTGFCGGFTTFSVFSLETVALIHAGATGIALGYVTLSLCVWLTMVWLGVKAGGVFYRGA